MKKKARKDMFKRYVLGIITMAMLFCSLSFVANANSINTYQDTGIVAINQDETFTPTTTQGSTDSITSDTTTESDAYPTLSLGSSGPAVVDLQSRLNDLGYYNYKVTGYYGDLTAYSVKMFQKYNGIADTGTAGDLTNAKLYANDAVRIPMGAIDTNADRLGQTPTPAPVPTKKPASSGTTTNSAKGKTGAYLDWFKKVQYMMPRGTIATVTDFYTGITFKVERTGGIYHADCETLTATDTANYKRAYGGQWSWNRRPVVVNINGTLVAGSMNGMPHGYDTIANNNLTGQFCIHFLNSRTHCSNLKDPAHQKCVRIAAGLS